MIEQIIGAGVSFFTQEYLSSLTIRLKGIVDQKKLIREINIYLEQQFTAKFEDSEINIDFDGLRGYLNKEKAMVLAFASILNINQDEREQAKRGLINQAIEYAGAKKPVERRAVECLVNAILSTIQKFYIDQCEKNNLAALNATIDAISKMADVKIEQIQIAIRNLISQLPSLIEKPIELITDFGCEWDTFEEIPRFVYQAQNNVFLEEPESRERLSLWDALKESRHIVLLGEAGAGKSVVLQELFVEASKNGFSPIYIKLKNYPRVSGLNRLFESRGQISNEYVLLLDGLDEIEQRDREDFFKAMNDGERNLFNTRIVVSSRLNVYDYQHQQNAQLDDFESYFLLPFTRAEQIDYVKRNNIDDRAFMNAIEQQSMQDISFNPFYFTELIKIWKSDRTIPKRSDLMHRIVKRRFDEDASRGYLRKLLDNERKIFSNIDRVALVMACTKTHEINNLEYQQIVHGRKTRSSLGRTGFINCNSNATWEFSHNIFGEYFAANMLRGWPKDKVFSLVSSSNNKLKPSWVNVFAFYCQNCQEEALLKQVIQNDLDSILQFEDINYSAKERTQLLISIMEQHEKAETMINWYYGALKKMVNFIANRESLQYLFDKLAATNAERHTLNILRVLQQFPTLYDLYDRVEHSVLSMAIDEDRGEYICAEAIRALRTLKIFKDEISKQLVAKYHQSENWLVLESIYFYLVDGGFAASYTAFILNGVEFFAKRDTISISAQMILREGQKRANTIDDLSLIFQYYQHNPNRLRSDQDTDVYRACCEKATELYDSKTEPFIQCFVDSLNEFWHYHIVVDSYKAFMKNTHTESIFLSKLLMIEDEAHCFLAIESMINSVMATLLIEQYLEDIKKVVDVVNWFVNRLNGKEEWFGLFDDAYYQKTKKHFQINENFIYQKKQKARMQRYFDALFNPSEYQQIVQELIDCIGSDVSIKNMHEHFSQYQYWRFADLHECANALQQAFVSDADIILSQCVAKLSWKRFVIIQIQKLLSNNNEVTLSATHHTDISELCLGEIKQVKLESVAYYDGNSLRFNGYVSVVLKLMEQQNVQCTQEMFLDMLSIPPELFIETSSASFSEYIVKNVNFEKLKLRIIENLEHKNLQGSVAVTHLMFCLDNKLEIAYDYTVKYLLSDDVRNHYKWPVLHQFYNVFGAKCILKTIVPQCNSIELLRSITGVLNLEEFSPELDQKILECYHKDDDGIWYELLIKRSNREALERYRDDVKRKHRIPDLSENESNRIGEITMAIGCINRIEVLDILGELLVLSYMEDFIDQVDFGLRSRLYYAFINIAKVDNERVVEYLESVLGDHRDNEELRLRIVDLLEALRIPEERVEDVSMTLEQAIEFVDSKR